MRAVTAILIVIGVVVPTCLFGQAAWSIDRKMSNASLNPCAAPSTRMDGRCTAGEQSKPGGIKINPFVQVGYQRNGVNMDVPLQVDFDPPSPIPHLSIGSINIALKDYNFWMGAAGVNVILSPKLTAFVSATGFLPREFVQTGALPVSVGQLNFLPVLSLTGSNLEYWMVQCGASYGIGEGLALLGGFIWGKNSMTYANPREGDVPLQNQTVTQDFLLKNWVPFVGLQVSELNHYRATLTYSPLVTSSGTLVNRQTLPAPAAVTYNLNQPGSLLSLALDYTVPVKPPSTCSLWFNATTQSIKGPSDVTYEAPGVFITRTADKLMLSQYSLAGGITLGLVF
jgi:hypothetical protein